jgi:hypothetical protein
MPEHQLDANGKVIIALTCDEGEYLRQEWLTAIKNGNWDTTQTMAAYFIHRNGIGRRDGCTICRYLEIRSNHV